MNNPSITDWVQALAVVVGVAFAIWELVLHDRADELSKRTAVKDLLLAGQSGMIMSGYRELIRGVEKHKNSGKLSESEWLELQLAVSPLKEHYLAWSYCYSTNLCAKELTLDAVCSRVQAYESIMSDLRPQSVDSVSEQKATYLDLLQNCDTTVR